MAKLRGIVPYFGGKSALATRLIDRIEAVPHACYAEPFVGGGGVILRRQRPAKIEAVNDISGDIVTTFRVAQRHPAALVAELRFGIAARAEFERLLKVDPNTLTDIERAARFISLQGYRYGAKPTSNSFSPGPRAVRARSITEMRRHLITVSRRLQRVVIERLDFEAFIGRYDTAETLFYLDPPYWGIEKAYGPGFARGDFERLSNCLRNISGRFIMSLNDRPGVRDVFRWAQIEEIATTYHVAGGGCQPTTELLISTPA
ncbi:DNA adenine methylase [Zavarzinia sp.]|uniref:DNA adenine methylase n=1 Tax=Zavarzinia sp. TaxID=2027920 RepID=UPI003BB4DEA2